MTDLIEKLRHPAYNTYAGGLVIDSSVRDDMRQAADEIERLDAELSQANEAHGVLVEECERLRKDNADEIKGSYDHGFVAGVAKSAADIDRLRAALKRIADADDINCFTGNPAKWPATVASNALNKQNGNKE